MYCVALRRMRAPLRAPDWNNPPRQHKPLHRVEACLDLPIDTAHYQMYSSCNRYRNRLRYRLQEEAAVDSPVTISRIAQHAQVSKATVSRVLNNKPDVDPDTAARVRRAIDDLGYVRSSQAISLATGRALAVGMLVPDLTWPMMLEVLRGVTEAVEASDYGLMLYSMARGEQAIRDFTNRAVRARQIDGLVVVVPTGMLDYLTRLHDDGLPMMFVDDRGLDPSLPAVATTNFDGGLVVGRHILAMGRRRPALIEGPMHFGCSRERADGFRQALHEAGVELDPALVCEGDFTEKGGARCAARLLAADPDFDALFAGNDLMAIGAMRTLARAGRRIPEEVAVVGFDDIHAAAHTSPSLTTVRQPFYEMGLTAARLLLERLNGRPLPQQPLQLPTTLIVRGSSGGTGA